MKTTIATILFVLATNLAANASVQRHDYNNKYLRRRVIGEKIVVVDKDEDDEEKRKQRYLSSKSGSKSGSGSR